MRLRRRGSIWGWGHSRGPSRGAGSSRSPEAGRAASSGRNTASRPSAGSSPSNVVSAFSAAAASWPCCPSSAASNHQLLGPTDFCFSFTFDWLILQMCSM
jgi:hypothetical protein